MNWRGGYWGTTITHVVKGNISSVSLLLHVNNHIYKTINPVPVYSLVGAPCCNDTRGIFGMDNRMDFYSFDVGGLLVYA